MERPVAVAWRRRVLLSAALPLLGAAAYVISVRPARAARIQQLASRLERLRSAGSVAAPAAVGAAKLQKKLEGYEAQLLRLERLIPAGDEVPDLLDAIAARARDCGVELMLVRPESASPERFYSRQLYSVSVLGPFDGIGHFLVAIGSLPRIVAPVRLKLAPLAEPGPEGAGRLRADFQVETFVAPSRGREPQPTAQEPDEVQQ